MAEEINIAELNFDTNKLETALLDTRKQIDGLSESIKNERKIVKDANKSINKMTQENIELAESGQENSEQFKANKKNLEDLNSTVDKSTKKLINNEKQQKELKNELKEIDNVTKVVNGTRSKSIDYIEQSKQVLAKEVNTIKEAREQNKQLSTIRNNVNAKTKEGKKALSDLNKKLNENTKFINENADKATIQKNNIGNYKSAVSGLSPVLGRMSQQLTQSKEALLLLAASMKITEEGTKKTSKSLKFFRIALISTGIGAIVVILGSLIAAFASTQAGIDKITSVIAPLKAILQSLLGVLQTVGEAMSDAFSNPQEAVKALWQAIKTNIVNRIKGLGEVFKALGKIISSGFTSGYKDLSNATLKTMTGVDNLVGKVTDAAKKSAAFFKDAAAKGREIDRLQVSIEQGEADLILTRAKTSKQLKELQLIANDRSLSTEKNNEAAKKALVLANTLADAEKGIINQKIKQEEIQQSLSDSGRKDLKKLNELKAQSVAADEAARATELKFLTAKAANEKKEKKDREDAAKKGIERHQKRLEQIIKERELALESFDLTNEGLQGSLSEEISLYRTQASKKKGILDAELKAEKISKEEYAIEIIKLSNETEKKETEATTYYIDQRISIERKALAQRQSDAKRLSDSEISIEEKKLDEIYGLELKSLQKQLKAKIISQKEFNEQSAALLIDLHETKDGINETYQAQKEADEKLKKTLEQEQKLLDDDTEDQRQIDRLEFQYQAKKDNLKKQSMSEENFLASMKILNEKHNRDLAKLEEAQALNKISLYASAAGTLADILGKETETGKFFASAQVAMATYVAATNALKIPPPVGQIEAALITIKGLANLAKINKIKTHMYTGGYTGDGGIFTRTGYTHAGEVVFNQQDVRSLGGAEMVDRMRPTASKFGAMPTGVNVEHDDREKWLQIGALIKEGVREGANEGTNSGLVDYSDNIDVKQKALF